jgi:TPR repeat protein
MKNTLRSSFLYATLVMLSGFAPSSNARPSNEDMPDQTALHSVWVYLDHNDCEGAVRMLNKGIANNQRDVLLMAGTMYEEGVCLKTNWEQATLMYQRAHAAGNRAGLPKLVAGYAKNDRDPAAAIWWAAQKYGALPTFCSFESDPLKDTEGFIAELSQWTNKKLQACVYTAAVLFKVQSEVEFPGQAVHYGIGGEVTMAFTPSTGTIDWIKGDENFISISGTGDDMRDRQSKVIKNTLQNYLQELGIRALKQYKKPDGIDPQWKTKTHFVFTFS